METRFHAYDKSMKAFGSMITMMDAQHFETLQMQDAILQRQKQIL